MDSLAIGRFRQETMALPGLDDEKEDDEKELESIKSPVQEAIALVKKEPEKAIAQLTQIVEGLKELSPSSRFEVLLGRGKACLELPSKDNLQIAQVDLMNAKELVSKSHVLDENHWKEAECLRCLGQLKKQQKKIGEAQDYFEAGLKLCRSHDEIAADLVELLLYYKDDLNAALVICEQGLKDCPDSQILRYQESTIHFKKQDWAKAHIACDAFLELGKRDEELHLKVLDRAALCCLNKKRYREACRYMGLSFELEPDLKKRFKIARKWVDTQLLLAPSVLDNKNMLAFTTERQKQIADCPEEALQLFAPLLQVNPSENAWLHVVAACIEKKSLDLLDAIPKLINSNVLLLDGVEIQCFSPKRFWLLAKIFILKGDRYWVKFLEENRERVRNRDMQFWCEYIALIREEKEHKYALELCQKALQIFPHVHKILIERAKTYLAMGEEAKAYEDLVSACRLKTEDVEAQALMAKTCLKMGKRAEACTHMIQAYQFDVSVNVVEQYKMLVDNWDLSEAPKEAPAMPDLSHMLEVAEGMIEEEKMDKGVQLIDYILSSGEKLSAAIRIRALLCQAHVLIHKHPEQRDAIEEILRVAKELAVSQRQKGEVYHCYGIFYQAKGEVNRAQAFFEESYKLCKNYSFLCDYTKFLAQQGEVERALKLWNEKLPEDDTEREWRHSWTYIYAEKWNEAIKILDQLLPFINDDFQKYRLKSALVKAYIGKKDYLLARNFVYDICQESKTSAKIEDMKKLQELQRELIIGEHLGFLYLKRPVTIPYLSAILENYEKELENHPKHLVQILKTRAELNKMERKWEQAKTDCERALRVLDQYAESFSPKSFAVIRKQIEGLRK